jgi:CheY-like chemotaxis protein
MTDATPIPEDHSHQHEEPAMNQPLGPNDREWHFVIDADARILVADDDPIFREFAAVHLATPSATVVAFEDGETAWDALEAENFDIALIDIEMPRLNGYELVKRIRINDSTRFMPVIMVTGREDISSIDLAFEVGATSFAVKPVNWRLLSYQIKYVLRATEVEREMRAARDRAQHHSHVNYSLLTALRLEVDTSLNSIVGLSDLMAAPLSDLSKEQYVASSKQIGNIGRDLLSTSSGLFAHSLPGGSIDPRACLLPGRDSKSA